MTTSSLKAFAQRTLLTQDKGWSSWALSVVITINLVLLLSWAIYLRISEVDHLPGVNADEALVAVQIADMMEGRPATLMMPTGRLLSPVYGVGLMIAKKIYPVSFAGLRLPAMAAGIALIALSFLLLRLSTSVGLITTVLLATSPVLIAYSRLGIEQSFIPLSTLLCVLAVLNNKIGKTLIAFLIAILVHPVSVFLLPLLLICLGEHYLFHSYTKKKGRLVLITFGILLSVIFILVEWTLLPDHYQALLTPSHFFKVLTDGHTLVNFLSLLISLLNGLTAFSQFSGSAPSQWEAFWQSATGLLSLCLLLTGLVALQCQKRRKEIAFVLGTLFSILGYYFVTGDEGIFPGVSRYAIWILIPAFLSGAFLLDALIFRHVKTPTYFFSLLALCAFGWLSLIQTKLFYFDQFHQSNTDTHESYWTGRIEPKQEVFQWILKDFGLPSEKKLLRIVAADWWTYWPLRYLALRFPPQSIQFYRFDTEIDNTLKLKQLANAGAYFVGFPGGNLEFALHETLGMNVFKTYHLTGYGEKPVIVALHKEK